VWSPNQSLTMQTMNLKAKRDMTEKISPMSKTTRNWYEIKNAASDSAEVFIYDDIGAGWFSDGVTAKGFISDLNAITASHIDLHLNSPGGSVFDGVAIYNALVRHQATVTTHIDGLAASIASIIALAGERVVMASNALFMIHNPWGGVQGEAADMRKMADVLDKIRETLANTYVQKTGMAIEDVYAALDAETWYTAEEALEAGFIDEIGVELQAAASFDLAAYNFKRTPVVAVADEACCEPAAETDSEPAVDEKDSEIAGAADSATSDGASDTPTPEVKAQAFVPGIGFVTF
jgi:ATP-dependent Clp protease, protease subunit